MQRLESLHSPKYNEPIYPTEVKIMTDLKPGLYAEFKHTVTEVDTASHWGSGGLPVFLDPGQSSVGGRIDVRNLKATPVGMQVRARAELIAVDGRKLTFKVQAWDEVELIGEAEHDRFVIDEARFMAKVGEKRK